MRALAILLSLLLATASAAEPPKDKGTDMNFNPRVSITPADCRARGLPPLEIHFDLTGAGLMHWAFPNPTTFFTLSGPPGGPCHFSLSLVRATDGKLPTLEELVRTSDRPGQNFALLGNGTITVCGKVHNAIGYLVKPTPWADHCAAVLIPLTKSPDALLLTFSAGFDATTGIVPGPSQLLILNSLTIAEK